MANWPVRSWFVIAGAAAVVSLLVWGCAPTPLAESRVIAGGSSTVSIEGGAWTNPDAAAEAYCDGFGKRAVLVGRRRLSDKNITDLFIYDCKDRDSK
jgi:hypothetical protein